MAEETTTTEAAEPERQDRVPLTRFNAVNEKYAEERKRAAELEARLEELESRDKSDVERLTRELEKMQKRASEFEARAVELESARERDQKSALVAAAAQRLKFHDPSLVAKIVDLSEIEDAKSAEAAVKAVAKDSPFLVQQDPPERQRLKQIGVTGDVIDDAARDRGGLVTEEELKQMWGQEIKAHLDAAQMGGSSGRM